MNLVISERVLEQAHIKAEELRLEIAVYLYDKGRLTMGQARKLAGMDQLSWQQALAERNVYIRYTIEDLYTDLENLESL
jgi:predicted HTH domain antitoxin